MTLLAMVLVQTAQRLVLGLEFDMIFQTKCVIEDISADTVVLVEYTVFDKEDRKTAMPLSVQVCVHCQSGCVWGDECGDQMQGTLLDVSMIQELVWIQQW